MTVAAVSPVPRLTFFDNAGAPLNGGLIYTYAAGGGFTPKKTYSDESLTVEISNPIVLNAAGRPQASSTDATEVNVYLLPASYKFICKTSAGATLWTADNVEAVQVAGLAFPLTVSGVTSGGVIYASSTTTLASSALLAANAPIIGGGAGTAPSTITAGNAGQVLAGTGTAGAPAFVGGMTLLHAATGTSTAAGATTVDSIAITGLTALDQLFVQANIETATANTAQVTLYSVTDAASLGVISPSPLTAAQGQMATTYLMQRQGTATSIAFSTWIQHMDAGGAVGTLGQYSAVTTAWTAPWTLGLRHGGVTATGVFKYTWAVYRIAGQ